MEKVKIEYEKWTTEDLLKTWNTGDKEELKALQSITYKFNINELLQDEEKLWSFENTYINQIIKIAEECGLKYCNQCGNFVEENGYINSAKECIDCAVGNGF